MVGIPMFGDGNGSFTNSIRYTSDSTPTAIVAADFNRDNQLDLAVENAKTANVAIILNSCL